MRPVSPAAPSPAMARGLGAVLCTSPTVPSIAGRVYGVSSKRRLSEKIWGPWNAMRSFVFFFRLKSPRLWGSMRAPGHLVLSVCRGSSMEGAWLGGRVSGRSWASGCQWQASHHDARQALVHQGWAAMEDKQVLQQNWGPCPPQPLPGEPDSAK